MNRIQLTFGILLLLAAGFILKSCLSGEEAQIRAHLSKLEDLVSFSDAESRLQSVAKAKRLSELFAENVSVELNMSGFQHTQAGGREEVMQAALAARNQIGALKASFHDITVQLAEDEQSAQVEATGRAELANRDSSGVEDFVFYLRKVDGAWLIERVENSQTFR